ncbi:MAG: hypothetical protein R3F59_03860 [Myxococcota bacterium]
MSRSTEDGLRLVLLAAMGSGCLGAAAELVLAEHWEEPVQIVPFVLAGLGASAAALLWLRPSRAVVLAVRAVMAALVLGGAFGMWEHLEHNYGFEAEIRPEATTGQLAVAALFGANPLLAPGVLAGLGLLGMAATWRHRRLHDSAVS